MANNKTIYNLSYSQDNPNVNKLIQKTFGEITKDDIRVGYIDPNQGYVINVSICEANDYAKKNPGTRFIFKGGNDSNGNGYLRYININEVNKLTPDDIKSKNKCPGIQTAYNCNQPPIVQILGGGGIGAVAEAIVSNGSLMKINVVRGGYGYQYPPEIRIVDPCGIGAGAVATAILGEIYDTEEKYENELEDYEICEPTNVGYGKVYGPNGEDLGDWDPTLYTNTDSNSIVREVKRYQEEINKYKNPFWATNKFQPSSITGVDKNIYRQTYKMPSPDDKTINWKDWTDFIKTYAVSPVPISNVPGSDNAGKLFIMQWDVDFPYDGEYIFRGLCDNAAKFYLDNIFIADLSIFNQPVTPLQKTIKKGIHNIRIDLINHPFYETKVIQQKPQKPQVQARPIILKIGYDGLNPSNNPINVQGNKILLKDGSGNDTNATFSIVSSDPGVNARFSSNGKKIDYDNPGSVTINLQWKDDPNTAGVAVKTISVGGVILTQKDRTGSDTKSFSISTPIKVPTSSSSTPASTSTSIPSTTSQGIQTRKIFNTVDYINKSNRQLWRINPNASPGSGFINQYGILPFDPNSKEAQTESFVGTHTIIWNNIDFPVDGNYTVHVAVDDNVTLYIGDTVIRHQGFYTGTSTGRPDLDKQYVFKKGTYTIRAELEQINVGPLAKGNPMALAVDINVAYSIQEFVSAKSWKENPMGVALTIDAPEPTVPQQKLPIQEGRCPPNPLWTTHFPGSAEKWYPVLHPKGKVWSNFMNRYALSPTKPLDIQGSDKSGITYKNSWKVKIPYKGYYGVKGCVDDTGSISIDGNKVSALDRFSNNNPKLNKVYLTEGDHTIEVEVYNKPMGTVNIIDQKIFSTKDWQSTVSTLVSTTTSADQPAGGNFLKEGNEYYLLVGGNDVVELDILFDWFYGGGTDKWGLAASKITIPTESGGPVVFQKPSGPPHALDAGSIKKTGTFKANKKYGPIIIEGRDRRSADPELVKSEDPKQDSQRIILFDGGGKDVNSSLTLIPPPKQLSPARKTEAVSQVVSQVVTTKNGITYEGPTPIVNYKADFISPLIQDINAKPNEEIQGKSWIFRWSNVNFPEDGEYSLTAEADDNLIVRVDGIEIGSAKVFGGRKTTTFNASKGKRIVELELSNIRIANTGFQENPVVGFAEIYKKVEVTNFNQKSWLDNPMGVSAVLIPPPCPRKVSGKGIIDKIIVVDPGNGYPTGIGTTSPVFAITGIANTITGIGYSCGVDKIKTIPDLGCKFVYTCDSFGRILTVAVEGECSGFTEYPKIYMETKTGINFSAIPILSPVAEPVGIATQNLIQVTDLAGLKQTGYVNGKPYYGAVYYENGLRYAGYYQSVGTPVRVYDTLQESITGEVTTPPSAIERFGTDVNSNNPRLNIPGTPENTIGP